MWSLVMCHIKIIPSKALWNHAAFFKVCTINGITFLAPAWLCILEYQLVITPLCRCCVISVFTNTKVWVLKFTEISLLTIPQSLI